MQLVQGVHGLCGMLYESATLRDSRTTEAATPAAAQAAAATPAAATQHVPRLVRWPPQAVGHEVWIPGVQVVRELHVWLPAAVATDHEHVRGMVPCAHADQRS